MMRSLVSHTYSHSLLQPADSTDRTRKMTKPTFTDRKLLLLLGLSWIASRLDGCEGRGSLDVSGIPRRFPSKKIIHLEREYSKDKNTACWIVNRGGSRHDDAYDEYDDDYDEEEEEPIPRRRPPPTKRHPQKRPPPSRYPQRRQPPPPPRGSSALSSAASLAKKSLGLTTAAATTTLKSSGKAAYYLVSPKHVARQEVWGVWRLDQQVGTSSGPSVSCAANCEFTPRGLVLTKYQDQAFESTFLFKEKSWPKSCQIEFEARAFQGPNDKEPVLMRYKGYFRRKLADTSVIKIVGNIYEVRKGGLWRAGRGSRKVGTFVARRRLVARDARKQPDDDEYDDYDDDVEDLDEEEEEESDVKEYDRDYDSDDVYDDEE